MTISLRARSGGGLKPASPRRMSSIAVIASSPENRGAAGFSPPRLPYCPRHSAAGHFRFRFFATGAVAAASSPLSRNAHQSPNAIAYMSTSR